MTKNEAILSRSDSIIENKMAALSDIWPDEVVAKLQSKIELYATALSVRRTMLLHDKADPESRKTQTDYLNNLRSAEKSYFARDASTFPEAYRSTVADVLSLYTGLRAGEILREHRAARQSKQHIIDNEALIRHWEQSGLIATETIVDGAATTVPNALWQRDAAAMTTTGTGKMGWTATEMFDERMNLFRQTAELSGAHLRQYVSHVLVPAHRAAEAEIARRYTDEKPKNVDNDTFRKQNQSLIHHADALEKRVNYALDKLRPTRLAARDAADHKNGIPAPQAAMLMQQEAVIPPATTPPKSLFQGLFDNLRDTATRKMAALRDICESGGRLFTAAMRTLIKPAASAATATTLATASAVMPSPLANANPMATNLQAPSLATSFDGASTIIYAPPAQGRGQTITAPSPDLKLEVK